MSFASVSSQPSASTRADEVVKRFRRLADLRGFIEIRPTEVAALAVDLGYRTTHWSRGGGFHWLGSHLAAAGHHRAMPNFQYRDGFPEPACTSPEELAASLNKLLPRAP